MNALDDDRLSNSSNDSDNDNDNDRLVLTAAKTFQSSAAR